MTSNEGGHQPGQQPGGEGRPGGQGQPGYPGPSGYPGQQPGGPGQGWNAPPPPAPQYPGYAPAPSAPSGYGAPAPVERPFAVRAGIGAFMANLILGLISAAISFSSLDTLVADALAAEGLDGALEEDVMRSAVIVGAVVTLVFAALQAMFIWFAWQGRNWARIVLWVLGGLSVVSGLASFGTSTQLSNGFLTALGWFGVALALAGIVLLAQKPANEWYRYRGWLRATGQGR
jgi:hypothetical protein